MTDFPNPIRNPGSELSRLDFHNLIGGPLIAAVRAQAQAAYTTVNFIRKVGFKNPAPIEQKKAVFPRRGQEPQAPAKSGDMEPVYVTFRYPKEVMPYQPAKAAAFAGFTVTAPGSKYAPDEQPRLKGAPSGVTAVGVVAADGTIVDVKLLTPHEWRDDDEKEYELDPPKDAAGSPAKAKLLITRAQAAQPAKYETMTLDVPILTMLPVPYLRIEEVTLDFNAKIEQTETLKLEQSMETGFTEGGDIGGGMEFVSGGVNFQASFSAKESSQYGNETKRNYSIGVHVKAVQAEVPAGLERLLNILQSTITPRIAEETPKK